MSHRHYRVLSGVLLLVVALVAILLIISLSANADTITVDDSGGEDYEKIQDAIDAASDGDTIEVKAGTYSENIEVDKRLTVQGAGNDTTIIDGGLVGVAVNVTSDWCNISGFNITQGTTGIFIGKENVTIKYCLVSSNEDHGIQVESAANVTIDNTTVESNGRNGIFLKSSNYCEIVNCSSISNKGNGILIKDSKHDSISYCNASKNELNGIFIDPSDHQVLLEVKILENSRNGLRGLEVDFFSLRNVQSSRNGWSGATFERSNDISSWGLVLNDNEMWGMNAYDCENLNVYDGRASGNGYDGFSLDMVYKGNLVRCESTGNFWGGYYLTYSTDPTISESTGNNNIWQGIFGYDVWGLTLTTSEFTGNGLEGGFFEILNIFNINSCNFNSNEGNGVTINNSKKGEVNNTKAKSNSGHGIEVKNVQDSRIKRTESLGNVLGGLFATKSTNLDLVDSLLKNNGGAGLSLSNSNYFNGAGVTCQDNTGDGVTSEVSDHGIFRSFTIDGNDGNGMHLNDCNENSIPDECTITNSGKNGLFLEDCNENGIPDECQIRGSGESGVRLDNSDDTSINGASISDSLLHEILVIDSRRTLFKHSRVSASRTELIIFVQASVVRFEDSTVSGSNQKRGDNKIAYLHVDVDSKNVTGQNVTFNSYPTTFSFALGHGVNLSGVEDAPSNPDGKADIDRYLEVTALTQDSWFNVTFHYNESNLENVEEASLLIYHHDGDEWDAVPDNYLDEDANTISANITEFSTIAPLGTSTSAPPIHNIDTGENFTTIQDAIDDLDTTDGHTIEIDEGTYRERIIVSKSLVLKPTGPKVTINAFGGYGVRIQANDTTIRNLTIMNGSLGILVYHEHYEVHGVNITGCEVHNFTDIGIQFTMVRGSTIKESSIHNTDSSGIFMNNTEDSNIIDCSIFISDRGIYIAYPCVNITMSGCQVFDTNHGIRMSQTGWNTIIGCTIREQHFNGIYLSWTSDNVIMSNWIYGNSLGITDYKSNSNLIYNNWFNNTRNADDEEAENWWNISRTLGTNIIGGPYLGGNFWNDYQGQDIDGDGLGDTKLVYNASGDIVNGGDHLPLSQVGILPVHNLDTDTYFETIQNAIDDPGTVNGHTIEVLSGSYSWVTQVTKELTIRSETDDPLDCTIESDSSDESVFHVTTNNTRISGFTLKGATESSAGGIRIEGARNCVIENNKLTGNYYGITLRNDANDNSIRNNLVFGNDDSGIHVWYCYDNTIEDNNASANEFDGILLIQSDTTLIQRNIMMSNKDSGIKLYSSHENDIWFNQIESNGLAGNQAQFSNGIYLLESHDNTFLNNSVSDSANSAFYSEEDSKRNIVTGLALHSYPTVISFTFGNGITIDSVDEAPSPPAGHPDIGKFVNITNVSEASWIELIFHYGDNDIVGFPESSLAAWRYNGTWSELPAFTLDMASNTLTANITTFSIFTALGDPGDNTPPTISHSTPANGSVIANTATFTGTAVDVDGDETIQTIEVSANGVDWEVADTNPSWSYAFDTTTLSNGDHSLFFRAFDGTHYSDVTEATFTVENAPPANTIPVVTILSPANNSLAIGIVTISGTATDADGDETIQEVELRVDDDTWAQCAGKTTWQFPLSTTSLSNGDHIVSVRTYDLHDYSEIAQITINVNNPITPNIRPTITITSPANGSTIQGIVTVSGSADDEDGEVTQVEIAIGEGDWTAVTGITSWSHAINVSAVKPGEFRIMVRAFDGADHSDVIVWKLTVKAPDVEPDPEDDDGESDDKGFIPAFVLPGLLIGAGTGHVLRRRRR